MRVGACVHVQAPIESVWSIISDPEQALNFMSGITRWEVAGEPATGLGARYRMLFRVRSAEVGGLIEIVEWRPPSELAWTSVTGLDQRGRWRLRPASDGRTRVELRLAYGVAGSGIPGWIAERVAGPTVSGHLRRTLAQLQSLVRHQQLRDRAATRRRGAAAS